MRNLNFAVLENLPNLAKYLIFTLDATNRTYQSLRVLGSLAIRLILENKAINLGKIGKLGREFSFQKTSSVFK